MNFAKQFRKVVLESNFGVLMVVDLLRDCALIYVKVTQSQYLESRYYVHNVNQ